MTTKQWKQWTAKRAYIYTHWSPEVSKVASTYTCEAVIDGCTCGGKTAVRKSMVLISGIVKRFHKCKACGAKATTYQPPMKREGAIRIPA